MTSEPRSAATLFLQRLDANSAPRRQRGLYTVSEAARFLALRHFVIPPIVEGRCIEDALADETLREALGFESAAQLSTALQFSKSRDIESGEAAMLYLNRLMHGPAADSNRHYERDLLQRIEAKQLHAIDTLHWESWTEYQGDIAKDYFLSSALVQASEVHAVEDANASTLERLPMNAQEELREAQPLSHELMTDELRRREDALAIEIRNVISALPENERNSPSAELVMSKLKGLARKDGSCVFEVISAGVMWKRSSGRTEKLEMPALRVRLRRLQKASAR